MENEHQLELPDILQPFEDQLKASVRQFVEVIPKEQDTKLWESKFGGLPYLPKEQSYPTDSDGDELFFLGQINFAEMPALAPFPEKGILQFYISDDASYGQDSENPLSQERFRLIYTPDIIEDEAQLLTDFSFLREFGDLPVYPGTSFGMDFIAAKELVPIEDHAFSQHMGDNFFEQFGEQQWPVYEMYGNSVSSDGHKIGGYAHFAQEDPRNSDDPYLLLCQFDTDNDIESMWGDMGTAHFFIKESDLKDLNFDKVWFHWDCY